VWRKRVRRGLQGRLEVQLRGGERQRGVATDPACLLFIRGARAPAPALEMMPSPDLCCRVFAL